MSTPALFINIFLVVTISGMVMIFMIFLLKKVISPNRTGLLHNLIKVGNYKQAIKVAKEILNKNTGNFEAHYYLGLAYDNDEKLELALIEYKAADKIGVFTQNINEYDLRDRLAELYIKFGKIEEAMKEYALLINKNPDDYYVNQRMGELFELKGNKQQAAGYYNKSLASKKNNPAVMLNLSVLLYDFKKFPESEKILQSLIKVEPENYKAYFYLGMIYKNQNDYKKALSFFEKAQKDKEYKVRTLGERGMIYMLTNKFEDAAIEFERAIRNSEGESKSLILNIRYLLASSHESLRNITEAVKQWEIIYATKPDFKNVGEKLASYQDLRMDDKMKDFMTATSEDFILICKGIALHYKLCVEELLPLSGNEGIEMVVTDISTGGWSNMKKKPKLLRIYRKGAPVEERNIRDVIEILKAKELFKAIVITASSFSSQAILYAQERPLQLIDKNELQNILKNINL